jgi:hypothetical protein
MAIAGVRFREAVPADAEALLALKRQLDRETSFMLLEPDERAETAEDIAADLGHLTGSNSVVIVAERQGASSVTSTREAANSAGTALPPTSSSAWSPPPADKGPGPGCCGRSSSGRLRTAFTDSS